MMLDHMSRYFFHIRDGLIFIPDEEGLECRDEFAAWEEALLSARDIAFSDLRNGSTAAPAIIEVEDEEGNAIRIFGSGRTLN
jgi:hypothetical protein